MTTKKTAVAVKKLVLENEDEVLAAMKMKTTKIAGYLASNAFRAKWRLFNEEEEAKNFPPGAKVTAYTDGHDIAFCREFLASIPFEEQWKIAVHEAGHYSLGHPERMKMLSEREGQSYDAIAALLAADDRVNRMLRRLGKTEGDGGAMPEHGFTAPDELVNNDMTFEDVYQSLKKFRQGKQGKGKGKGKGKQGQGQGQGDSHDGHEHDGKGCGTGVLPSKKDVQGAMSDAIRKTNNLKAAIDEMKSRGLIKGNTEYDLEAIVPKRSWDDLLSEAVSSNMSREDYSLRRRNQVAYGQLGTIMGSLWKEDRKCVMAVDTSGSMSDLDIARALGVVQSIAGEVIFIQADTDVQQVDRFDGTQKGKLKIAGRGGTAFKPVFEYVAKMVTEEELPPQLVYMTDGHGDEPTIADYKGLAVTWLVTPGGKHPAGDGSGRKIDYEP